MIEVERAGMRRAVARLFTVGAWVALAAVAGCAPEEPGDEDHLTLTAAHDGQRAAVSARKLVTVRLRSQPSTGYVWDVAEVDHGVLRPLDEADERSAGLGGVDTHVHRFVPVARGRTTLRLVYHRPWETDVAPAQTYAVDLDVEGGYAGPAPTALTVAPGPETFEPAPEAAPSQREAVSALALPSAYSFCSTYGCTPVKNQGSCGSCWAFATVGVAEQLVRARAGVTRDFSEQYVVSCNPWGYSCNGGNSAFGLFIGVIPRGESASGAVYETSFPYRAANVACNPPHTHHERLSSAYRVGSTDVTTLKNALYAHGPLWTTVCADSGMSRYTGGVFTGSGCTSLNHAVVLVGWNDNGGYGYWIMRNSWGSGWGNGGYMYIRYGANRIGANSIYATY